MGWKFSKEFEAELLAKADKVGSSTKIPDDPLLVRLDRKIVRHPPSVNPLREERFGANAWTFRIPNWSPTPVNKLYDHHWASRRKHKKSDAEIVAHYGRGVPKASQKRAVSLHVIFPPGKRMPDVDAYAKSLLDALVHCGLLVNDSSAWCVLEPVAYSRGQALTTFITVEDI